jgi:hypothetical protein
MSRNKLFWYVNIGLIIAIAASAVLLGVQTLQSTTSANDPGQDVPYTVKHISGTQVQVIFGNFTSPVKYTDVNIVVTAPNGDVSRADVKRNVLDYPQTTSMRSLNNIHVSSTGVLTSGESFTIQNNKNLQSGVWAFKLVYKSSAKLVTDGEIIIPDPSNPPLGSYSDIQKVSDRQVKLTFGLVNPPTEFSSCYLEVRGPNTTTRTLELNNSSSMTMTLDNATTVQVVDVNGNGVINSGDYVLLSSKDERLAAGQWSLVLKYAFTGDVIANSIFELS